MTDRSRFELLATSILRKAESRYSAIIHTGVNAQGETIVSPIDGLHLIPHSDPPHYIFAQHTTTDRQKLRDKWLSPADGDLTKAVREASSVRQKQPAAVFTVVLTTNQRVDPQLALDVHQRGADGRVAVDIWEQSRLADFLDTTADGQWLRRYFLGIEADRLSVELLHELGRRSLELYRQELLLPGHGSLVHREVTQTIVAMASPGGPGVCLVTGRSGFGKSIATALALEHWLASGYLGLWLPARILENALSLDSALDVLLRSLHPTIQVNAGRVALDLASEGSRLLLCIDDINRAPEAARLLRLIVSHAASHGNVSDTQGSDSTVDAIGNSLCQVVPIWPEQLATFPPNGMEKPWIRTVSVGDLIPEESSAIIRAKVPSISSASADDYATRLHHDPFLVGLFALMADEQMEAAQLVAVADDAIGLFVDERLRALDSTTDLLYVELRASLIRVAHEMIRRRILRPTWAELEWWFGADAKVIRGMRLIIRQGQICGLDARGQNLDFRHDRLREWFLVNAMSELIRSTDPPEDIINEPYFSGIVGKALASAVLSAEQLSRIRASAPWVIFEAIRQIAEPTNDHQHRLFQEARAWAEYEGRLATGSVKSAICWTLVETDSSRALPIINAMAPSSLLMAAGLRNGSARHGMRYIRPRVRHDFEPGNGDAFRDRIIEHAYKGHRDELARQLREELSNEELGILDAKAYLALLGHLRLPGFDDLIRKVWEKYQDDVLAYSFWAAARCPLQNLDGVLVPMMSRIATLPMRESLADSMSVRESMTLYLGWGFRRGISDEALTYLIEAGRRDQSFRPDVSLMVEGVDHPEALEFLARHLAEGGGSNLWSHLTGIGDGESQLRPRSSVSTDRLRSLWVSNVETDKTRTKAFCLWLQAGGCKDVALLATIESNSPFHRYAVQHRIKQSDKSVVPELIQLLKSNDIQGWWWRLSHRVWCGELRSLASETLKSFRDHIPSDFSGGRKYDLHSMAGLLVKIPVKDGEELLRQHWSYLKYCPEMIHTAFRIGSPECVRLAREALVLCPYDVDIFEFAFSEVWNKRNQTNPITLQHLKNLEPYLDRMSANELLFLAWETEMAAGADDEVAEWTRINIVPKLPPEERVRVQVADEKFLDDLDRSFNETNREPYLGFLFRERTGQIFVVPERRLRLLGEWLSSHRTVRGLSIAAECLRYIGTRLDLELLDRYDIAGDDAAIKRIKSDARFSLCKRTLV